MRTSYLFDQMIKEMNEDNYRLGQGLDIYKADNVYHVAIDLPGFNKEDIKVDYKDDLLTIDVNKAKDESAEEREYFVKNRKTKRFYQQIRFSEVDEAQIAGEYLDGVLKLTLPIKVKEEIHPRRIEVK